MNKHRIINKAILQKLQGPLAVRSPSVNVYVSNCPGEPPLSYFREIENGAFQLLVYKGSIPTDGFTKMKPTMSRGRGKMSYDMVEMWGSRTEGSALTRQSWL